VSSRCPGCETARRRPGHYLCATCWAHVPRTARRALARRDPRAAARLRALYDQLAAGTPLTHLEIT
jgi:hypothetical protein